MTKPMLRISVRNLVEFVLRSGNIDNRRVSSMENAMAEGGRIHRMLQKRMGSNYTAEVSLKEKMELEEYDLVVEGRADGIFYEKENEQETVTIDEIKCTYRELHKIKEPVVTHLAQAKCYAYIYAMQNHLDRIRVRMTYCNIDSEDIKYFQEEYSVEEIKEWFFEVIRYYRKWADLEFAWKKERQQTIKELSFPFAYRDGQKDLVTYVYQTIYHRKKLFIEAPTGVGKTISTIFPAIKAIGEEKGEKLFYFTAKTITRTVALDTFQLLREHGLKFKTVVITAKEKICPMEEVECNPEACPYAKGHYDRINDAVFDLLTAEENYTREKIEEYAKKHQVCPFEMGLDMTLFSDGIVCDYNYLFDPHVYLKRFFAEGAEGDYLFLVDEAHNLLDRGREMYSATLKKEDFLQLKKVVKLVDSKMEKQLEKCNKELLQLKRECENYQIITFIAPFVLACNRLYSTMDKFLQENDDSSVKKEILEFYFEIAHFLDIYERMDDSYVTYTQMEPDGSFIIKLLCVNPAVNLKECMAKGRSTILFSATLLPIQYYKNLLGGEKEDYEVYARSMFEENKRALLIGYDVTSKYTRRTDEEFYNIAAYIHEVIKGKKGNYMIFFPSHAFLQRVYQVYMDSFYQEEAEECIVQDDFMNEGERERFLSRFEQNSEIDFSDMIQMEVEEEEEKSLLGFCVLGGIFSEGIDLKSDRLIGVIIVGTGLPQVCNEREIFKNYFDEWSESGFDYAYRYPAMNKVLQAAGRVIRTAEDIGVVVLLDERFRQTAYQRLFPREWKNITLTTKTDIAKRVEEFWKKWI